MKDFITSIGPILPLISVLIGSIIAFTTTRYFSKKTDDRAIRQTAAQLAQHLDVFSNNCSKVISENELFYASSGAAGTLSYRIPSLPPLPENVDLQLVEAVALSRLLSLGLKRKLASEALDFNYSMEVGPDPDPDETNQQCGILGMEAVEIAEMMRSGAKLPEPNYGKYHYDFSTKLRAQKILALKHRF